MTLDLSRRAFLASGAAASAAAALPCATHEAVAQAASQPLRIAMSISDLPRMWGGPEAGFEGLRFGA